MFISEQNRSPVQHVRLGEKEQESGRLMFSEKSRSKASFASTMEAPPRLELGNRGFAVRCLTTWLWRHMRFAGVVDARKSFFGAAYEARTRYLHLGKVALYRMSYARKWCLRSELNQRHADFQSAALPTELQRRIKFKWWEQLDSNQ